MTTATLRRSAACAALALALSACGTTQPSRFFELVALADPASGATGTASGKLVGLETVRIPDIVDRPQFVTSLSEYERNFNEYLRWAQPLAPNMSAVLAENLSELLAPVPVLVEPGRDGRVADLLVRVEILHFDARADGDAVLEAHWTLCGPVSAAKPLAEGTGRWLAPAGNGDPDQFAAAMSRNLLELSRALAEAISHRPAG